MPYDPATKEYLTQTERLDPSNNQRLSPDPIGFASGTTNLTAYANNNTVGYVDPSGECTSLPSGYSLGAAFQSDTLGGFLPNSTVTPTIESTGYQLSNQQSFALGQFTDQALNSPAGPAAPLDDMQTASMGRPVFRRFGDAL